MGNSLNLAGKKFWKLLAIEPTSDRRDKKIVWRFLCDCGKEVMAVGRDVANGNTKSCGCLILDTVQTLYAESRVDKTCPTCGKNFVCKKSHALKTTYCSQKCMSIAYRLRMSGANNPNYKGITDDDRRARSRKYRQQRPEAYATVDRNTKARRKLAPGKHTTKDIASIRQRQEGLCATCRCAIHNDAHVDHIIPMAKGGSNSVGNLQLLCPPCNLAKQTLLPIEFRHKVLQGKTEDAEQSKLFYWAHQEIGRLPSLALLYHAANGGYRTKATGVKLQKLGVKKGVPDICFPIAKGKYTGLYIELKVGRNKPTPEQRAWISALNSAGNLAVVAYGWEQARDFILDYLSKPSVLFPEMEYLHV